MYSLLIVEDEPLERCALRALMERDYAQLDAIYESDNGSDALTVARREKPDILLVDINIPGLSGLEMVRTLTREGFDGRFVVTTAYEKFEYVVTAMELSGAAYLLKPVQDDQLRQALYKCFAQIDAARNERMLSRGLDEVKDFARGYLIRDMLEGKADARVLSAAYGWPADGALAAYIGVWSAPGATPERLEDVCERLNDAFRSAFSTITAVDGARVIALMQPGPNAPEAFVATALWCLSTAALGGADDRAGMGRLRLIGPLKSYAQIREAAAGHRQSGAALAFTGIPPKKRNLLRQRIVQRVREGHAERVVAIVRRLEAQAGIWPTARLMMEAFAACDASFPIDCVLARLMEGAALSDVAEEASALLARQHTADRDAVDTALSILHARYDQPLLQSLVAEEVGLSQAYFSRLFKQKTGEKFVDVLSGIRLAQAKALIDAGDADLAAIAQNCGYSGVKHFAAAFKRAFGASLCEYRARTVKQ